MKKDFDEEDLRKVVSESKLKDELIAQLKVKTDNLEEDLNVAERNWKELNKTVKIKDKELHESKKEKEKVIENLEKMSTDFKNLTTQVNKEKKAEAKKLKKGEKKDFIENLTSKEPVFQCSECEVSVDSLVKLQIHVSTDHVETTSTQTECTEYDEKYVQTDKQEISIEEIIIDIGNKKFIKFSCFYCDKKIQSENELVDHRGKCRESYPTPKPRQNNLPQPNLPRDSQISLFPTFFNCEHCCWIVTSKAELMSHEKMCLKKPKI